jgi:hypothetical protein
MRRTKARLAATAGGLLAVTATGLLGLAHLLGCNNNGPTPPATGGGTTVAAPPPKTYDAKPAVLMSSRTKEGRYVVAIDFANSKAENKSVLLDERRKFVAEQSAALYADYAKKEKPDQAVRLFALSVPNRDEYARGDFKNMDELAVFDTVHATAVDANKSPTERVGTVEWRKGLSE